MKNFDKPYFSRNIADFWRRWHISLNTWFRDYLYIPLGGNRGGTWHTIRNTYIVFLTSGLWHGANWTFVIWGLFHATCFLPLIPRANQSAGQHSPIHHPFRTVRGACEKISTGGAILGTFLLVVLGWAFFRAPNIHTACFWIEKMLLDHTFMLKGVGFGALKGSIIPVMILLVLEVCNFSTDTPKLPRSRVLRWLIYYLTAAAIIYFRAPAQRFIYFQF